MPPVWRSGERLLVGSFYISVSIVYLYIYIYIYTYIYIDVLSCFFMYMPLLISHGAYQRVQGFGWFRASTPSTIIGLTFGPRFYLVNFYLWSRRRRLQRLHNLEAAKARRVRMDPSTNMPSSLDLHGMVLVRHSLFCVLGPVKGSII